MNPFVEAIRIVETRGWTRQPKLFGGNYPICIGMALDLAMNYGDKYAPASLICKYVNERYGTPAVIFVNDHIIETHQEAVNVLRECARRWETRGTQ